MNDLACKVIKRSLAPELVLELNMRQERLINFSFSVSVAWDVHKQPGTLLVQELCMWREQTSSFSFNTRLEQGS